MAGGMSAPSHDWPTDTAPLPPSPPPAAPPPEAEPGNRIGLGMLLAIVLLAGAAAALAAVLLTRHHGNQPRATPTTVVVTTAPVPTTPAAKGTKKKLILPVPDLVGSPRKNAATGLRRAGFKVSYVSVPSALPRGTVTGQDPKPATKVAKGSDVRLKVSTGVGQGTTPSAAPSSGVQQQQQQQRQTTTEATTTQAAAEPATASVPGLSGDLRSAVQQLDQSGLTASIAYVPGTQPLGSVIAQSPAGGSTAKTHSQVTVNVSAGPNASEMETVPNVVGRSVPQALSTLNGAGLRLVLLKATVGDRSRAGTIVAQTPLPGKQAPKNAQVLVYMGAFRQ
jgi:serine/threonine-protein kinase